MSFVKNIYKRKRLKIKVPKQWVHPQAWASDEFSFYLALLPFVFWPLFIVFCIFQVYNEDAESISLEALKNFNPPTVSYIYADDLTTIAELYKEHRMVLPLEEIPQVVIDAFIAAEDNSFYSHYGVDFYGLTRATIANFQAKSAVQGASTITQQMVRTFLLTNEKTIDRKLKEMVLSFKVETMFSKEEILYLYLNRIYLGRGAYGIESAAKLYFGKSANQLTLPEAAMLAGLVKAPSAMAAHLNSKRSLERQAYVLERMVYNSFITQQEANVALKTHLVYIKHRPNLYREKAPQYAEVVRRQVINVVGEDVLLTNGLKIYTSLNLEAQAMAEEAVNNGLKNLARRQRLSPKIASLSQSKILEYKTEMLETFENRPLLIGQEVSVVITKIVNKGDDAGLIVEVGNERGFIHASDIAWFSKKLESTFKPGDLLMAKALEKNEQNNFWVFTATAPADYQAAFILIENKTGAIKAMVGGRDYGLNQFNRAVQALRQPGSSFKPIVYTAAIDNGFTEASIINDSPVSYPDGSDKIWQPKNYSGRFSGPVTLYEALIRSLNVVAVKLGEAVGPEVVVEYSRKMGINSPMEPNLSISLGAAEVTLLELTTAYTTFPNKGSWVWPSFIKKIEGRNSEVIAEYAPYFTKAISEETAYILVDMLTGVTTRGTAARVGGSLKRPVGGKTGTSNSQADTLFIGFTPEYTCGIWVGRDARISLGGGEQGGRTAAPIFIEFMNNFLADTEITEFEMPKGVVRQVLEEGGRQYVFKKDEIGRGEAAMAKYEGETVAEPVVATPRKVDYNKMSKEELDKGLLDDLQNYELGRSRFRK